MIEQLETGDKITTIKVSEFASTTIREITIDSIQDGKIIFAQKRKKYQLTIDSGTLVLNGHNLGIKQGSWNNGTTFMLMDANCNLGGLDRESMIILLKTNINEEFNQWNRIYWFDGVSDKGDPIFKPRPVSSNYLQYQEQAESNKPKTAQEIKIGEFIYAYFKGSQFNNLTDMLTTHLEVDGEHKEHFELGKVVDIIDISEEEFDALQYMERVNFLTDKGGSFSDDIAEGRDFYALSSSELETLYAHYTLIRTPSGRAITADAHGDDYIRYTGLLPHYRASMQADCDVEIEKIEKERTEKEQEKTRLKEEEQVRIEKEYVYLTVVAGHYDYTTAAKNMRNVLKKKFPLIKFSATKHNGDSYHITWTDGPIVKVVDDVLKMFIGGGNSRTRVYDSISNLFMNRYGFSGYLFTNRTISEPRRTEVLDAINKEMGTSYAINDYVTNRGEYMSQLVHKRTCETDYSPKLEESATPIIAQQLSVEPIKAEGIEIVPDYSEKAFAVIGDTKPIKDTLKKLGGAWNSNLKCGAGWIFSKTKLETVKEALSMT